MAAPGGESGPEGFAYVGCGLSCSLEATGPRARLLLGEGAQACRSATAERAASSLAHLLLHLGRAMHRAAVRGDDCTAASAAAVRVVGVGAEGNNHTWRTTFSPPARGPYQRV